MLTDISLLIVILILAGVKTHYLCNGQRRIKALERELRDVRRELKQAWEERTMYLNRLIDEEKRAIELEKLLIGISDIGEKKEPEKMKVGIQPVKLEMGEAGEVHRR